MSYDELVEFDQEPEVGDELDLRGLGRTKIERVRWLKPTTNIPPAASLLVVVEDWEVPDTQIDTYVDRLADDGWEVCDRSRSSHGREDHSPLFVDNPLGEGDDGRYYKADRTDLGWLKRCIQARWEGATFDDEEAFAEFVRDQISDAVHVKSIRVDVCRDSFIDHDLFTDKTKAPRLFYSVSLQISFSGRGFDADHYSHELSVTLRHVELELVATEIRSSQGPLPAWARKLEGS